MGSRTILSVALMLGCLFTPISVHAGWTGAIDKVCGKALEQVGCSDLVAGYPEIYGLVVSGIATARSKGIFMSGSACRSALFGKIPELKALIDILDKSGVYGRMVTCGCATVFESPSCTGLVSEIANEIVSPIKDIASEIGLGCEHPKIGENQYFQNYLAPILDKYALATEAVRQSDCYAPTGECWGGCYKYYRSGSAGCRMAAGNASYLCDLIVKNFAKQVMLEQPVLVGNAVNACVNQGDGCTKNKDRPLLVDTYGKDTKSICLSFLKNEYPSKCIPKEQPCCWCAPWPPELKCKKVREQAPSKVGNLAAQTEQSFGGFTTGNADAKMIADLKACRAGIIANTQKYLSDAACDLARKLPMPPDGACNLDFSGIWHEALKQAKDNASGDCYTKCDSPYYKQVKINNCKVTCSSAATLKSVYGKSDEAAKNQCFNDCMSGALAGKMKYPGFEQSQAGQQASCIKQCNIICENVPTSVQCQNCKKPNWCGSGSESSSGAGSGTSGPGVPKLQ